MEYLVNIGVVFGIYAILAVSLDQLVGQAGIYSLAHAAFFGVGAYTVGLASAIGVPPLVAAPLAILAAIISSFAVSLMAIRLRDDYMVVGTFGFTMIVFTLLNNIPVLGGPQGISGIRSPDILVFGSAHIQLLILVVACIVLLWGGISALNNSDAGLILRGIRDDEILLAAIGKHTRRAKIWAMALAAAGAGSAGIVYAWYFTYIDPTSFSGRESIAVLAMVIIGGAGTARGPIVGAAIFVLLPEALRFLGVPGPASAAIRQIIYGGLLTGCILWRPGGIVKGAPQVKIGV